MPNACKRCNGEFPRTRGRQPRLCAECRVSHKWCPLCEQSKRHSEFGKGNENGLHGWCRECHNEKNREYHARRDSRDAERRRAKQRAAHHARIAADPDYLPRKRQYARERRASLGPGSRKGERVRKYGLSVQAFDVLAAQAAGVCAICREADRPLYIDHDHSCCGPDKRQKCGECVRGLLCQLCNTALGHLRDDIENLTRAIAYLKAPPARAVAT